MTDTPTPAPGRVTVPADALRGFAAALLEKGGLSTEHARTTADVFVWAALRGVDSHGTARVTAYLELLAKGTANGHPEMTVTSGAPGVAVLDADRAPGPHGQRPAGTAARDRRRLPGRGRPRTSASSGAPELGTRRGRGDGAGPRPVADQRPLAPGELGPRKDAAASSAVPGLRVRYPRDP
ncbi:Ldh family oxidoreductase, partial [Streptomyces sp. NPDC005534]|uniref:Ldh family oxidoreductase n=1 Tax=Streptomyces sp. NPDC005534 TaxID=3155714 RepID=UPI003451296B